LPDRFDVSSPTVRAITGVPGVRERVLTEGSSSLFFLPLSHILARVVACAWCTLASGSASSGILASCPRSCQPFRPTILLAVPRVFEKVAAAAREQAEAEGHQRLFAAAKATAIACSRAGRRAGMLLRLRHAFSAGWSTRGCARRWEDRRPGRSAAARRSTRSWGISCAAPGSPS